MAPSTTSLYGEKIDRLAVDPEAVATAAAAAHSYVNVFWPAEGVHALHLTTAIGFLELLSNGEPLLGASFDDFAVLRTAIAAGMLCDNYSIEDRRIVDDVLSQAMGYLRKSGTSAV